MPNTARVDMVMQRAAETDENKKTYANGLLALMALTPITMNNTTKQLFNKNDKIMENIKLSMIKPTTAEKRAKREKCQFSTLLRIPTQIIKISEILYSEKNQKSKNRNSKTHLKQGVFGQIKMRELNQHL